MIRSLMEYEGYHAISGRTLKSGEMVKRVI